MAKKGFTLDVKMVDKGWDRIVKMASISRDSYVKVGVIGDEAKATREGGAIDNVQLAQIHEFGAGPIPERSFIRATFAQNKPAYMALLRAGIKAAYLGKADFLVTLRRIGLKMEADMKKRITTGAGIPPPLAPATIRRKGSSRPLVDTGQLVNSISSEVVK